MKPRFNLLPDGTIEEYTGANLIKKGFTKLDLGEYNSDFFDTDCLSIKMTSKTEPWVVEFKKIDENIFFKIHFVGLSINDKNKLSQIQNVMESFNVFLLQNFQDNEQIDSWDEDTREYKDLSEKCMETLKYIKNILESKYEL